ncbi:MAG TPA: cell division protein FtsL [Candidatus Binatia bacterium]|jgi:cell division protein FtsL
MAVAARAKPITAPLRRERPDPRVRQQRRRESLIAGCLGVCLVTISLVHVWVRLQVVRMGYVLSTGSKLQSQLEQEGRELKVELATLTSPERLEEMARKRLGLQQPEKGQVVVLP